MFFRGGFNRFPRDNEVRRQGERSRGSGAGRGVGQEQKAAALKIQSRWRGRQERIDAAKRRNRQKPWGYYTHTLTLMYNSCMWSATSTMSTKRIVFMMLEEPGSSRFAQVLSIVIVSTIVISISSFILETVPEVYRWSLSGWLAIEVISTLVFTVEYCVRIAVCDQAGISRISFVISPMNFCDLIAVLPFYIEAVLNSVGFSDTLALRAFRVVRVVRMVRIFKLGRYASGMRLVGEALRDSSHAISVLLFLLSMAVVLFSSALYHVEKLSCPDREQMTGAELLEYRDDCTFPSGVSPKYGLCCTEDSAAEDFPSIVAATWWSLVTMTSVGYGEVYPKTPFGKCVGAVVMLIGMLLIALPVAIVGQNFQDVYESHDLEDARNRAANRMRVQGEVWSLVPASDILPRLRHLRIKDPALAGSVAGLVSSLEVVWEQREQLGRELKLQLDQETESKSKLERLLSDLETANGFKPQCAD